MDTTIIKVRSVNEATDRTVSLPVPTAMTASDMVTGVYASLASLRGWLITGSKAFKAERAGVCTEKLKPERSDPPRRACEVMTPIAEPGEIGASLFKNRCVLTPLQPARCQRTSVSRRTFQGTGARDLFRACSAP